MKKIVFTLVATLFFAGILFTSCNSPTQKTENARDNLQDKNDSVIGARIDLYQTRHDSVTEFQQFKTDFQNLISANEKTIAGLKLSYVGATKENKALNDKKLAELEDKNNDLKNKLAEYNEGETDHWQTFKSEFKRDMDELGKAFSDFTVSN